MSGMDDLHVAKNNLMEALGDKSQEYVITITFIRLVVCRAVLY